MQQRILQGEFEKQQGIYYEYDPHSKPIGEGGMGVVYKGFRVNSVTGMRQFVAIKAMRIGLPDEVYSRARREAGIQLKNDNLVEMLGFISTKEQEIGIGIVRKYYVISEFLSGVGLTDLLKGCFKDYDGIEIPFAKQLYENYISDRETTSTQIIKRILSGIMALHDKGYIHRDIDPSNIIVTKEGNLKLIDFGIAKDVSNINTQDGLRTATGKFIGKAEYAAPELVLGDVHSQNFTTDIYAIGILFYQLLVGKLPFEGPKYDVLQNQLKKNLPIGNIPYTRYRSIIRKATEKQQHLRFQSCVEMRLAIDTPNSNIKWKSLNVIISCIVLTIIIGFGAYIRHIRKPIPAVKEGDIDLSIHESKVDTLYTMYSSALYKLNSDDSIIVRQGWHSMNDLADKDYSRAKQEIGLTIFIDDKVSISSQIQKRRDLLDLDSDIKQCQEESKILLSSISKDTVVSGETLAALGVIYYRKSDWDQAMKFFKEALPKLESSNDVLYKQVKNYINNMN